jgi:hypothetical protein
MSIKKQLHLTGQLLRLDTLKKEVDEDTFRNASVKPDKDGELLAEEQDKAQVMVKTNKVHHIITK